MASQIVVVNEDLGVNWLFSFLSADKKKTYCVFEAPNPDLLIEAGRRVNMPYDAIVEVSEIRPEMLMGAIGD